MAIDYKRNLGNPNYLVKIAGLKDSKGVSLKGVAAVMQNELAIAAGNEFSTAGEQISAITGGAFDIGGKLAAGLQLAGRAPILRSQTRMVWTGSRKPSFNIEISLLSTKVGDVDPIMSQMKRLQSSVFPGQSGELLNAPLGYTIKGTRGTLILEVGKWFRATNLVATDTNFAYSKEVMSDGSPLFITGSITLEPYQALTYDDFLGYFRV